MSGTRSDSGRVGRDAGSHAAWSTTTEARAAGLEPPASPTSSHPGVAHGRETSARLCAYDAAGRLERTVDVARGATTTYVRDDAGQVLSTTDALGHTTSRTYDVRGAMATMTDAASHTWTYATTPTSSTSTTPLGETTTSTSTSYGLPLGTTFPGGATTASTQHGTTSLDESYAYPASRTDESGRTRSFDYDGSSGLIGATDLGGHRWAYTYEPIMAGEVSFDVESGRVSLVAPDGEPGAYRFSGGGPFQDQEQLVREAAGAWQHALGTVTSPMGEVTRYGYDTEGHRTSTTLPSGGVHAMTYAQGHLDTETLPFGTTLEYTRDAAFRELTRTGSDGSFRAFTYGPGDRVETIEDDTGVTTYDYDAAGRFAGLDYPELSGGSGGSVHIGRDALDQIASIAVSAPADASPRTTTYVRDAANRITEIHDPLGGVTFQTYDANGRLRTRTLPNGITSTWTYDARSRVDTIVHARADHSVFASLDYDRNPSGEPFRITREDGTFVMYGYDGALRLTSERYFDATHTQVDAITYTYDDDGNRTTRTTSAGTETYHYAAGSELTDITMGATTIAHYDYDDAGRVVHRTRGAIEQQLDYDVDDHLVRVADPAGTHEVLWDFDAAGRRVRREDRTAGITTGVGRFEIAPTLDESLESPHAVTDDAGNAQTGYVFAGEHPLFRYDATSGEVVYYLQDSMGPSSGSSMRVGRARARFRTMGSGTSSASPGRWPGCRGMPRGTSGSKGCGGTPERGCITSGHGRTRRRQGGGPLETPRVPRRILTSLRNNIDSNAIARQTRSILTAGLVFRTSPPHSWCEASCCS